MRISRTEFERLVATAIAGIPERLRSKFRNVALVVADAPTPEQCRAHELRDGETMYGCYEGVALPERDLDEPILPDRIVIFQQPLEEDFGHDPELLADEVARTVAHEIAHHFGIDDDRLEELDRY